MLPSKQDVLSVYNKVSSRVKQYALSLTPLELKVDEATNNDPWGPHGTVMAEISSAAFDYEGYKEIMGVIARRLQSEGENWRHVYKSLLLLEYMTKHGPQKVAEELSSNVGAIERLQRFEHKDKNGKDWGLNVRQRAGELANLVSNPERVRSERQKAEHNKSKYTGVSSEASRMSSRMGGFGSASSSFGPSGSSALSSLGGGSKTYGNSSATGFGSGGGFNANSRYDDHEAGHSALNAEDPDEEDADAKEATRKRIEALRKQGGESPEAKGSPLKGSRAQAVAAEQESRGPKKLSQVRVNPSIASSLKGPSSSPGSAAPQQASSAPILDLFAGNDAAPVSDPAPAAAATANADSTWNAFAEGPSAKTQPPQPSDDWAGLLDGGGSIQPPQSPDDPFAAFAAPASQNATAAASSPVGAAAPFPADPFASLGSGPRKAEGRMPIAPAPPKASQDPFARLAVRDTFAPTSKPQSPLNAAQSTPKAADPFANDPFSTTPQFPAAPAASTPKSAVSGSQPSVAPSSRVGQALPEDMFAMPGPSQGFQVRVGTNPQPSGGITGFAPAFSGSPSRFAPSAGPMFRPQAGPSAFSQPSNSSFAHFSAASQTGSASSTEDLFGNMSLASAKSASQTPDALGGGFKMAPNVPQPNLPPPVVKQDPFAGLAGF